MCVYAELGVPKYITTEKEWAPSIILSTFGDLVAVSGESTLVAGALEKLTSILDKQGFNYIAEAVARAPYDGNNPGIKTWWQRYFDYL